MPDEPLTLTTDSQRAAASRCLYRANNALGVCFVSALFLFETVIAHQTNPSAASPYIWASLGLLSIGSLAYYLRFKFAVTRNA